jgi:caffeoyl-CoA O-methyltransferase
MKHPFPDGIRTRGALVLMIILLAAPVGSFAAGPATSGQSDSSLDRKVATFLRSHKNLWRDENVSEADGRFLFEFLIKHKYTRCLEIGTSTGRSGIWIAWAMSRIGGRLTTIEIDKARYEKAIRNFEEAGLTGFIDARLDDAHDLVPLLKGPYDFVFVDADKEWYLNYFKMLWPRLDIGGCYAVHNVVNLEFMHGIKEFLDYIRDLPEIETIIEHTSKSGISLSFKKNVS